MFGGMLRSGWIKNLPSDLVALPLVRALFMGVRRREGWRVEFFKWILPLSSII